jgi:hypothetical protein
MNNIILNRIKNLEVSKRPLHCTDIKRETMYIRDDNEWNKDTEEKTKLKLESIFYNIILWYTSK